MNLDATILVRAPAPAAGAGVWQFELGGLVVRAVPASGMLGGEHGSSFQSQLAWMDAIMADVGAPQTQKGMWHLPSPEARAALVQRLCAPPIAARLLTDPPP